MPLPFLTCNVEGNPERLLMLALVALETVQFELQILLLVQQLLQSIRKDNVRIV